MVEQETNKNQNQEKTSKRMYGLSKIEELIRHPNKN